MVEKKPGSALLNRRLEYTVEMKAILVFTYDGVCSTWVEHMLYVQKVSDSIPGFSGRTRED